MLGQLLYHIKLIRFIPALLVFVSSSIHSVLKYELERWLKMNGINKSGCWGFMLLMSKFPEYRSLLYYRTGKRWLRHFAKGQTNLYFHTPSGKIGKGLVIWHGYSTVINAESIGENCSIWHNVTIGKKTIQPINDKPTVGNSVSICTGAIVIGNITIADNVSIGAGSVVVESVMQENAVIVGYKAKEKNK